MVQLEGDTSGNQVLSDPDGWLQVEATDRVRQSPLQAGYILPVGFALMPCVLIVEDDMDVRELMDVLLTNHGFETMTAANGREALERMRNRRPCVVLLDLMMPIMDGWQFRAEQLREPSLADVPVVCVTAVAEHTEMVQRLRAPCLRKPIEFCALLEAVEGACGSGH